MKALPWYERLPQGEFSFAELGRYLKCSHVTLRKHCAALGIEVTAGRKYREGTVHVKRVYKRQLRLLTPSEATRIMLRHRENAGQRTLKRAQKERRG